MGLHPQLKDAVILLPPPPPLPEDEAYERWLDEQHIDAELARRLEAGEVGGAYWID